MTQLFLLGKKKRHIKEKGKEKKRSSGQAKVRQNERNGERERGGEKSSWNKEKRERERENDHKNQISTGRINAKNGWKKLIGKSFKLGKFSLYL